MKPLTYLTLSAIACSILYWCPAVLIGGGALSVVFLVFSNKKEKI